MTVHMMGTTEEGLRYNAIRDFSAATWEKVFDGMHEILWQDWWERVWVIQEIAMSSEVIFRCGNCSVSWRDFHTAVDVITPSIVRNNFPPVLNVLNVWKNYRDRRPPHRTPKSQRELLDVLQRFRSCEATDPLDKIYALLRLADDVWLKDIKIDYEYSPEELYTQVVIICLEQTKSLDILAYALEETPKEGSFPHGFLTGQNRHLPARFTIKGFREATLKGFRVPVAIPQSPPTPHSL